MCSQELKNFFTDINGMFFHPNEDTILIIGYGTQSGQPIKCYTMKADKHEVQL